MTDKNRFKNWRYPVIKEGKLTKWNWMVQYVDNFKMGRCVDIGAFTYINAKNGIEIEDEAQIGSHCSLYSANTIDGTEGRIVIKSGAMIGSHSVILPGVTIGRGAKIGAFSLVKTDVPDGAVVCGRPVSANAHEDAKIRNAET